MRVTAIKSSNRQRPIVGALLATTMIAGLSAVPATAQQAPAAATPPAAPLAAPGVSAGTNIGTIRAITVVGTQRL
jgi:outer membrane protein insertion porin family